MEADQRGRKKEKQVDLPCLGLGHPQHQGQPEQQQTPAADTKAGEEAQNRSDHQTNRQGIQHKYRIPPQRINTPSPR